MKDKDIGRFSNLNLCTFNGGLHFREGGAYFKGREIINMKFSKLSNFILPSNCQYDI